MNLFHVDVDVVSALIFIIIPSVPNLSAYEIGENICVLINSHVTAHKFTIH